MAATATSTEAQVQLDSKVEKTVCIDDYLFFCSEHPTADAHYMSNWFNHHYLREGPYMGVSSMRFWCSEQELMLEKLSFCANKELAAVQKEQIMTTTPTPVIPVGEEDWEAVWERNHALAANMKHACRLQELKLDIAAWDARKGEIMLNIVKNKFSQPSLAALLKQTGDKIIVEAAHYDADFGVGLQSAVHRPRGKAEFAHKSILELDDNGEEIWKIPPGDLWGKNLLGHALMQARAQLTAAEQTDTGRCCADHIPALV